MSFQRDIIVVNQFSVLRNGKGTKGKTPGKFVLRYMARDKATELLTPVAKKPIDSFITRYMARTTATEVASNVPDLKLRMQKSQGLGGRSFGKCGNSQLANASLSDREIRDYSKTIQDAFDQGKTVLESVISFDGNYLKKHNLVSQNIKLDKNGHALQKRAFAGKLDQMKLRLAIMNGLERMADRKVNGKNRFEDLAYVGVIQVDTKQVHCHLAMVDLGSGNTVFTKGKLEQKGVLNEQDRQTLRRGIDNSLDQYQMVRQLSSDITKERQNAKSFVKRYTERAIKESSLSQIIMASLPENRKLWRAKSNSREMTRANEIVKFYVEQVLSKKDSGYQTALRHVNEYALNRQKRENLSNKDYQKLVDAGNTRIVNSCMDSVYDLIRKIPERDLQKSTRMLDYLSLHMETLKQLQMQKPRDPLTDFSFHLRSYSTRLKKHRSEADKYQQAKQDYLKAEQEGKTDENSLAMLNFYNIEGDYQNKLASKYQMMLPLISKTNKWRKQLKQMQAEKRRLDMMQRMLDDDRFLKLHGQDAEKYGQNQYGLTGGRYISDLPELARLRFERAQDKYKFDLGKLRQSAMYDNKSLDFDEHNLPIIINKSPYSFDDIKAYDIHDVLDDFDDLRINKRNQDIFLAEADKRVDAYAGAVKYATVTNQPQILSDIDRKDIELMKKVADKLRGNIKLNDNKSAGQRPIFRHKKVLSVDKDITKDLRNQIIQSVKRTDETYQDQIRTYDE